MTLEDKLIVGALAGIRDCGRSIFGLSQRYVPVRTGRLKRSGRYVETADGCSVYYGAPYAAKIELGTPAHQLTIPSYVRRSPRGVRYRVQSHTRVQPGRPARSFVGRAIISEFRDMGRFIVNRLHGT
jgi:hypothetical protein